jgi:hypothetical protein
VIEWNLLSVRSSVIEFEIHLDMKLAPQKRID